LDFLCHLTFLKKNLNKIKNKTKDFLTNIFVPKQYFRIPFFQKLEVLFRITQKQKSFEFHKKQKIRVQYLDFALKNAYLSNLSP